MGERPNQTFDIDIDGSGIKDAVIHTTTNKLATQRVRIVTPQPSTPDSVAAVVAQLTR